MVTNSNDTIVPIVSRGYASMEWFKRFANEAPNRFEPLSASSSSPLLLSGTFDDDVVESLAADFPCSNKALRGKCLNFAANLLSIF